MTKTSEKVAVEQVALAMLNAHYEANSMPPQTELGAFDQQYRKDARVAIEAYDRLRTEPAGVDGEPVATVREIETVTGDFLTDPGEPFYRIELNGYCADFDTREAAQNFADQINLHTHPPTGVERAQIVAWLESIDISPQMRANAIDLAFCIKRGDHRRGK